MVRVVDCNAGVLSSNPGGPRYFPLGITSTINEDRDQMLHSAASDPGLHCLSMYYILTSL